MSAPAASSTLPPVFDPPADGLFPVPNPSLSLWLQKARADSLLDHQSPGGVPAGADVVILGSGLSGSLVAYELLHSDTPPASVVLLEAREACSGATGRNAGHCKPVHYRDFPRYQRRYGTEVALQLGRIEQATFESLVAFVQEHGISCELWTGDTFDVAMSEEVKKEQMDAFEAYSEAGGRTDHIKVVADPVEAAKMSRLRSAQSVISWPAATLNPWQLVAHLLRESIKRGLNFQTYTPATLVTASSEPSMWDVHTSRGVIKASKVVHATNAFASTLLPPLQNNNLVAPTAFTCNRVVPPPAFSGSKSLQNSYGVLMRGGARYSVNPRSTSDGLILFGGDNPNVAELDKLLAAHPELESDDRLCGFKPVTQAVVDLTEREFEGWGVNSEMPGGQGVGQDWSGIIGSTQDGMPWIGRVPELEGQFPAVAKLVLDPTKAFHETGLPGVFEITAARMSSLQHKGKL